MLKVNPRWKAHGEIYKIYILLHHGRRLGYFSFLSEIQFREQSFGQMASKPPIQQNVSLTNGGGTVDFRGGRGASCHPDASR